MTNDSYINVVDRYAEIENYCIYIALDSDFFHSRQLRLPPLKALWANCIRRGFFVVFFSFSFFLF